MAAEKQSSNGSLDGTQKKKLSLNARLIKALAHPLRVQILDLLNDGEWSPRELETELSEGLSQVSYHIKVLKDFELIEMTRTEPRRGATEHYYRAIERAFVSSEMASAIPKSAQPIIGDNILRKIDNDVDASLKSGRFFARDDWHISWTPVDLDDLGCGEAEKLADTFVEALLEIGAKSAQRRVESEDGAQHIAISAAVLVFGSEHSEKKKAASRKPVKKKKRKGSKK